MVTQTTTSANDLFSQEMRLIHELRESQKETDRILQETARELQELGKKIQTTTENVNGGKVEMEDLKKAIQITTENVNGGKIEMADVWKAIKATTENVNGGKIEMADAWKAIKATTENVNGIAKSNGMFAEDYFYNALETKQIFAGIHFDKVLRNQHAIRRLLDGNRLESEFDLQLTNRKAVALISLKYRVRKSNVKDMVERQVVNFRQLFPEYDGYQIYLGLGGMSFDKGVVDEAKKLGIGLLQQKGKIVEYVNDEVKPY